VGLNFFPCSNESPEVRFVTELLVRALPYDRIDVVGREKLVTWTGRTILVNFDGIARPVGVLAQEGRHVRILAVDPSARRQGVGTALLEDAIAHADKPLRVGDQPGNYLSPGVDERYEEGLRFLAKRGFIERGRVENIRVPYANNPLLDRARAEALEAELEKNGYRVATPSQAELPAVLDMIGNEFAPVWAKEARRAYDGPRRALFAAFTHDGAPVAFAAADGNNQGLGWFGPAGTRPAHRGKKLGEALLLRCLFAVEGLPEAGVIAWIGPRAFYERAAGAVHDRRFVQLERA
jgi:GNAT superfamily N-acetyltransferase